MDGVSRTAAPACPAPADLRFDPLSPVAGIACPRKRPSDGTDFGTPAVKLMEGNMTVLSNDLTRISSPTRTFLERNAAMFVDGQRLAALTGNEVPVLDPSSGSQIAVLAAGGAEDVDRAVAAARQALVGWSRTDPAERERLMWAWSGLVEQHADMLAEIESLDVGMPFAMSRNMEMAGTLNAIRYMAGWPTKISGRTVAVSVPIPGAQFTGYTLREPVGVVAAIIPWNVPMMMAAWKIAPAIAAGCTIVVKPSEVASLSVLLLAELAAQAGIPPGVINIVTGPGRAVGEALVRHPDVAKISFTGSTRTGIGIATAAAQGIKKLTLELGGKSPQLMFADADLDRSIPGICDAIFTNSGQICVSGSRLYVQRPIYDTVVERLRDWADARILGGGLRPETQMGPLANVAQQTSVLGYIDTARDEGGEIVTRDARVDAAGSFVRPTVVANSRQSMTAVREEIFGPVLTVQPFDDTDEAIALGNDTEYGLSACIWTRDLGTAHRVAAQIRSGKVAINTDPLPYPSLPEGGRKASGYGRDLGEEAIEGCLETKSVLIRTA